MKDKLIRLLKAIGIALLVFGIFALLIWLIVKHEKIAFIISIALIFFFVVREIYMDLNLND